MVLSENEKSILGRVQRAIEYHLLDEYDLDSIDHIIQEAINREEETESMYL